MPPENDKTKPAAAAPKAVPKTGTYRVLEKSFINNAIAEVGDIVEYTGEPGTNLELVSKAEAKKAEEADETLA